MFPEREHPRALEGFEILRRLGAGGVGDVYLARSKAGKLVAIKVVGEGRREEGAVEAFAREASLCVRLHHPCIVQVRAFLEEPGFAALVYEYVPGVALGRLLRFCAAHKVRLPDRVAWHIVERVVTALSYAHSTKDDRQQAAPIVHRDLSPSNVLVDWSGGVKITDFGIAKMLGVSPATRVGLVKGTLGCMAPEQARGEAITERVDIFAAGLLAWRLATGRAPFERQRNDEIELIRAMRNPRLKPLAALRPDLPEPILRAVAMALEPDALLRTLTANEFALIVRDNIDVARGWLDLGELLSRWRGPLERSVRPREVAGGSDGPTSQVLEERATSTIRYEELALAFDEDTAFDAKTIEHHALPSDPGMLAAIASDRPPREIDGTVPIEVSGPPIVPSYPPSLPAFAVTEATTSPRVPEIAPMAAPASLVVPSQTRSSRPPMPSRPPPPPPPRPRSVPPRASDPPPAVVVPEEAPPPPKVRADEPVVSASSSGYFDAIEPGDRRQMSPAPLSPKRRAAYVAVTVVTVLLLGAAAFLILR